MLSISRHQHPVNALLQPKALAVTVLSSEALAAILSLTDPLDQDWPVQFGLLSLALLWISITLLCSLAACRPLLYRLPVPAFPWIALALLITTTGLIAHVGWEITGATKLTDEPYGMFMARALSTALIVGMLALLVYQVYLQGREAAIRRKEAELALLRARVQPHFLFNTLNTGIALLHHRPQHAEQLLLDLSELFRATLGGPSVVTLQAELALARRYLAIEELRFGEKLQVDWNVDVDLRLMQDTQVPAHSVQPLLENAVKHGIQPELSGGRIGLSMNADARHIRIDITNTLPDASDATASTGHGIGLQAVRDRLEAFRDGSGRLETRVEPDGTFTAILLLPR